MLQTYVSVRAANYWTPHSDFQKVRAMRFVILPVRLKVSFSTEEEKPKQNRCDYEKYKWPSNRPKVELLQKLSDSMKLTWSTRKGAVHSCSGTLAPWWAVVAHVITWGTGIIGCKWRRIGLCKWTIVRCGLWSQIRKTLKTWFQKCRQFPNKLWTKFLNSHKS